eukprot:c20980_g1_i3.p1 GENE.c20980_g1_i3~~c20980_g1_i3.p1  ORF type:complete len:444 (+),score=179.20 c20980_g1_i3:37-1368(+)
MKMRFCLFVFVLIVASAISLENEQTNTFSLSEVGEKTTMIIPRIFDKESSTKEVSNIQPNSLLRVVNDKISLLRENDQRDANKTQSRIESLQSLRLMIAPKSFVATPSSQSLWDLLSTLQQTQSQIRQHQTTKANMNILKESLTNDFLTTMKDTNQRINNNVQYLQSINKMQQSVGSATELEDVTNKDENLGMIHDPFMSTSFIQNNQQVVLELSQTYQKFNELDEIKLKEVGNEKCVDHCRERYKTQNQISSCEIGCSIFAGDWIGCSASCRTFTNINSELSNNLQISSKRRNNMTSIINKNYKNNNNNDNKKESINNDIIESDNNINNKISKIVINECSKCIQNNGHFCLSTNVCFMESSPVCEPVVNSLITLNLDLIQNYRSKGIELNNKCPSKQELEDSGYHSKLFEMEIMKRRSLTIKQILQLFIDYKTEKNDNNNNN